MGALLRGFRFLDELHCDKLDSWSYLVRSSKNLPQRTCCTAFLRYHRRVMQKANLRMLTGRYLNIILVIVESGSVYLLSWILFMVMVIIGHPAFVVVVDSIAQITVSVIFSSYCYDAITSSMYAAGHNSDLDSCACLVESRRGVTDVPVNIILFAEPYVPCRTQHRS